MGKRKLKSTAKINRSLAISIILFLIVAGIALYIVLNKGRIFNTNLVAVSENNTQSITQTIEVEADKKYLSATDDEEANLTVKIDGIQETEGIEYISSDEEVLEVDENGVITAQSVGMATVTAKKGELTATTDIHVIKPIKSMNLTSTSKSIKVGNDLQLKLTTTPSDGSIETLTYTSSDESIATVNANGIVTGVSKGKVTITVHDDYTDKEKSVTLTIK